MVIIGKQSTTWPRLIFWKRRTTFLHLHYGPFSLQAAVFFLLKYSWCTILCWFQVYNIQIHYKMITTVSLVIICPYTKLLQYHLWYSLCYTSLWLIYNRKFVAQFPAPISPLSPQLLSSKHRFVLSIWACFHFVLFFRFYYTYKWDHAVCLSLFDISLSIIPSRSIHVVINGKILATVINAAMNIGVDTSFQISVLFSSGKYPEVVAGSYGNYF